MASLGGAVRNESEAILEIKSTSNPPPHYREWRPWGDAPKAQSEPQKWWGPAKYPGPWHTVRFEFDSPIHKSRRYSWLFGHRPQQPQGELWQASKDIELSRYPAKERNGGYLKAKDLTVQARASFNLIAMAHLLPDHQNAYIHKHIHRFPENIPG